MKKKVILIATICAVALPALAYKDSIYENYLQRTLSKDLTVDSGTVTFCGVKARDEESANELIERVKDSVNAQDVFRHYSSTRDRILADTDEIKSLEKQAHTIAEAMIQDTHKKTDVYTREKLLAQIKILREEVLKEHQSELFSHIDQFVDDLACKLGDPTITQEKKVLKAHHGLALPESELKELKELKAARWAKNKEIAIDPLTEFTNKYLQATHNKEHIITMQTTSVEDNTYEIEVVNTVTSIAPSGDKVEYTVGCEAYPIGFSHIFGSAIVSRCYTTEPGDEFRWGEHLNLFELDIFVEDHGNEAQWNRFMKHRLDSLDR